MGDGGPRRLGRAGREGERRSGRERRNQDERRAGEASGQGCERWRGQASRS